MLLLLCSYWQEVDMHPLAFNQSLAPKALAQWRTNAIRYQESQCVIAARKSCIRVVQLRRFFSIVGRDYFRTSGLIPVYKENDISVQ